MPVLTATHHITPKSIIRHRPIGNSKPTKAAQRASRIQTTVDGDPRVTEWKQTEEVEGEGLKRTQVTSSKASGNVRAQSSRVHKRRQRMHPLVYLSGGMVGALILWTALSTAIGWFNIWHDDVRYGRPRTFQTDAFVGHNEQSGTASHFVALNLNRRIQIIEIQGGDPAHTRIYVGPQLYNATDELSPATLEFRDINGDHKPDMIILFQTSQTVFINENDGFRPLQPDEREHAEKALSQFP